MAPSMIITVYCRAHLGFRVDSVYALGFLMVDPKTTIHLLPPGALKESPRGQHYAVDVS